ncbi:hypothetical protein N8935_07670 [Amylibacter sp.]|nr:hypothetical protein [Amylibacter sp.]
MSIQKIKTVMVYIILTFYGTLASAEQTSVYELSDGIVAFLCEIDGKKNKPLIFVREKDIWSLSGATDLSVSKTERSFMLKRTNSFGVLKEEDDGSWYLEYLDETGSNKTKCNSQTEFVETFIEAVSPKIVENGKTLANEVYNAKLKLETEKLKSGALEEKYDNISKELTKYKEILNSEKNKSQKYINQYNEQKKQASIASKKNKELESKVLLLEGNLASESKKFTDILSGNSNFKLDEKKTFTTTVKQIQTVLLNAGCYDGSPDGIMGAKTRYTISKISKSFDMIYSEEMTDNITFLSKILYKIENSDISSYRCSSDHMALFHYEAALKLLDGNNFELAIKKFDKLLENTLPISMVSAAHFLKGDAFFAMKNWKSGGKSYLESYKNEPKGKYAAEAMMNIGISFGKIQQKSSACMMLSRVEKSFPRSPVIYDARNEMIELNCGR